MEAVLCFQRTLKEEGRALRSIGNNNYYIPDCKISLAFFARYFPEFIADQIFSRPAISWSLQPK